MTESNRPETPAGQTETDTAPPSVDPPEQAPDTDADTASAVPEKATRKKDGKRGGRGAVALALFAILIALAAAAGVAGLGYLGLQRADELDARMATVEKSLESNVQDLLVPRLRKLESRLDTLAGAAEQRSGDMTTLQDGLRQSQAQLSELADMVQGGARRWQLLTVESLLAADSERIQLYHDAEAARQALELASRHLAELNDPRLFEIRQQVVDEIAAINALPDPDIEGMALTLNALIKKVPKLPLVSRVPERYAGAGGEDEESVGSAGVPPWRHFLDSLGEAMQGMFTIRRGAKEYQPLMPPDQEYFLYQNLVLKLETARLALLARQGETYRDALVDARDWLKTYFDGNDAAVAGALEQIRDIEKTRIDWQAPDVSGSLTGLREFMRQASSSDVDANEDREAGAADDAASAGGDE